MDVGVRELKRSLSAYLQRVQTGETLTITARGKPIARLEPVQKLTLSPEQEALWRAGKVNWSGRPTTIGPGVHLSRGDSIADKVIQDRERD